MASNGRQPCFPAQLLALSRIINELINDRSKLRDVAGLAVHRRDAVIQDIHHLADTTRNDRPARRHVFDDLQWREIEIGPRGIGSNSYVH